jgi:hypothetical protein
MASSRGPATATNSGMRSIGETTRLVRNRMSSFELRGDPLVLGETPEEQDQVWQEGSRFPGSGPSSGEEQEGHEHEPRAGDGETRSVASLHWRTSSAVDEYQINEAHFQGDSPPYPYALAGRRAGLIRS